MINYWGADGMGKSALLAQLRRELAAREPELKFVSYDLANGALTDTVLSRMTRLLHRDYELEFPLFDYANYVWQCNKGEEASKPEVKGLIERSPFLRTAASLLGAALPTLGFMNQLFTNQRVVELLTEGAEKAAQALNISDHLFTLFASLWKDKKYQYEFNQIETADAVDLVEALPRYFTSDLCRELEQKNEPIAFFIDTYEELLKNVDNVHHALRWLYGDDGLARMVPNALWVIASRDALDWAAADKDWSDISAESLRPLEPADRDELLADIGDASLRATLCEQSGGEPWRLADIAARCARLNAQNKTPELADFVFALPVATTDATPQTNAEQRRKGLLDGLPEAVREGVLKLSCLDRWNWDMLAAVIGENAQSIIDQMVELPFVEHDEFGAGIAPTTGAEIAVACPADLREATLATAMKWCLATMNDSESVDRFGNSLLCWVDIAVLRSDTHEKLLTFLRDLDSLSDPKDADTKQLCDLSDRYFAKLITATEQWPQSRCRAIILGEKADYLSRFKCDYENGLKLAQEAHEILVKQAKDDDEDLLEIMQVLAFCLYNKGDYWEAQTLQESVLAKRNENLGENHPDTIIAMYALANTLNKIGNNKKTKQLYEQVLAKSRKILGINHPLTLLSMNDLAIMLSDSGNLNAAKRLFEQALSEECKLFGEKDLETLQTRENYALVLYRVCDIISAKKQYELLLSIYREVLGDDHPNTLKAMDNLAITLYDIGDYSEAKMLFESLLVKYHEFFGKEHSLTIMTMENLGYTLRRLGIFAEAEKLLKQVIQARLHILGLDNSQADVVMPDIPNTPWSSEEETDNQCESQELLAQLVGVDRCCLGLFHLSTLMATYELAKTLKSVGNSKGAKYLLNEALPACRQALGRNHPLTKDIRDALRAQQSFFERLFCK